MNHHVEQLLRAYLSFEHTDDVKRFMQHEDAYTRRLVDILEGYARAGNIDRELHFLLKKNAAYIYEFLPIYHTETGQAARRQAAALLLTQAEYRWLTQDPTGQAARLRRQAMDDFAPDIHERNQWALAEGLESARQQGLIPAVVEGASPVEPAPSPFVEPFPNAVAFLASLPQGMNTHPECQTTAEYVNLLRRAHPDLFARSDLPPRAKDVFAQDLPDDAWMGQAVANLAVLLVYDGVFRGDDRAFAEWTFETSKKLYGSPLNRAVMFMLSPKSVVQLAVSRWGRLHRNSALQAIELQKNRCTVALTFPQDVFSRVNLLSLAAGYRAAISCSGGHGVSMSLVESTGSRATFSGQWSDRSSVRTADADQVVAASHRDPNQQS